MIQYLAWPAAFLIIGIFFIIFFRKDISMLLARTEKIGKDGLVASTSELQKSDEKQSTAEELMRQFDSIVLLEQEKAIKSDLDSRGTLEPAETIDVLIRHLATTQITLLFEYINTLIWGSQIALLNYLNSKPQGEIIAALRPFYDFAAQFHPDVFENYLFEQYMNFIVSHKLIVQQTERYFITNLGKEFLRYLVATGRTGSRPF
jgi:hypothetical protein